MPLAAAVKLNLDESWPAVRPLQRLLADALQHMRDQSDMQWHNTSVVSKDTLLYRHLRA